MSVITNNLLLGEDGYNISRSVRLRSSASAYFSRTPASTGNRQKWTFSGWVKRGTLGAAQVLLSSDVGTSNSTWLELGFDAGNTITLQGYTTDSVTTAAVFRDPSAWYHVVVAFDTTQATSANRCKIYVNGTQQTLTGAGFTLNADYGINNNQIHAIGQRNWASGVGRYFDGYLTEVNFIDGQALTASSFGEIDAITGVWKPKKYAGTYGTNGFYLNFADNSAATAAAIGKDSSGNGNNWTPNNISVTSGVTYDSMLDVPTMWADGGNGRGNYAVLNPINLQGSVTSGTITEANLKSNPSSSAGYTNFLSSIAAPSTGYWYAEFTVSGTYQGANNNVVGILAAPSKSTNALGLESFSYGYWDGDRTTGSFRNNNTTSQSPAGFQTGDVLMVALGNGNVWFGKNGTWLGTGSPNPATATSPAYSSLTGDFYIGYTAYGTSGVTYGYNSFANFGQRPFAYTPPTGFKALNTQNLPDATIKKGNAYFNAVTYTGNGATGQTISGAGFQPDLVWVKSRSAATDNGLQDAVRGATKDLNSNNTDAEETRASSITAFTSDGFTLGGNDAVYNSSGATYVGWQWKESVSAGFDIVTYTGQNSSGRTVAHSLGVKPAMIIIKNRSGAFSWNVQHQSLSGGVSANSSTFTLGNFTSVLLLNSTQAAGSYTYDQQIDGVGNNLVAYLFAEVAGYSKFGSYTGNGSTDGPFVFTGFRPRFLLIKATGSESNADWLIYDTARNTYNTMNTRLWANLSAAETSDSAYLLDTLSNGFKIRTGTANVGYNNSGSTYIYAAFAENPFKNSLAR